MDAQAVAEAFVYWQAQGLVSILAQDPLRVEYRHPGAPATLSQGGAGRYAAFNQALQQALRESLGESGKAGCFSLGRCSGSTIGWRYSAWKRRRPSC